MRNRIAKRNRNLALLVTALVLAATICVAAFKGTGDDPEEVAVHVVESAYEYSDSDEAKNPITIDEVPEKEPLRKVFTIGKGDSIYRILTANGISSQEAYRIINAVKPVFNLAKILPGHELDLIYSPEGEELLEIVYEISYLESLGITFDGEDIKAERKNVERVLSASYNGNLKEINTRINKGDSVYDLLSRLGICDYQIDLAIRASKKVFSLGDIVPEHGLTIWVTQEKPVRLGKLSYEIDSITFMDIVPQDGTFRADIRKLDVETVYERAEGQITSSLYESGIQAGLAPEIVMGLTDIFAWDINFFTDIRPGDSYSLIYEKLFVEGEFKGFGRVVAARFVNQGNDHVAVYYSNGERTRGYYDPTGKPIRKLFLKAPLNYRRISSRFTYHRMHPVFHVDRPHLGVDYAAPSGTPVVALGDGKVIFKGWNGGFGECIKVKHRGDYVTYYGHLSRYARGLRKGKYVEQGQVIGYVGSTGVSTGPHLDFRVRYKGKFINPLRLKPVAGDPLKGEDLASFREISVRRLAMLDDHGLNIAADSSKNKLN